MFARLNLIFRLTDVMAKAALQLQLACAQTKPSPGLSHSNCLPNLVLLYHTALFQIFNNAEQINQSLMQ